MYGSGVKTGMEHTLQIPNITQQVQKLEQNALCVAEVLTQNKILQLYRIGIVTFRMKNLTMLAFALLYNYLRFYIIKYE